MTLGNHFSLAEVSEVTLRLRMITGKTPTRSLVAFASALLARALMPPTARSAGQRRACSAAALLLLASPATLLVAQTFRGSIAGSVMDATGAAVSGAQVEAVDMATGSKHDTTSSSSGEFSFSDLPLGSYTVTSSDSGFGTVKVDQVPVSAGVVYSLPITMTVAQTSQTVEVSAAGLSLDTTSVTQTTLLPSTTVQNTPMNGRDFTQLIAITPGFAGYSAGGFGSVNGTRANQVNWQIDGSDNNDLWHNIPAVNQGGVEGIAGVTLPLDSIEQFSEQTQSGPEAGRNPGGTVNVVTKSGTNNMHGSLYYYNRNEALAKNSPFVTPNANGDLVKNELRNQQYGASVGGPILKDKFFYFANYEKQQFIIENPASATLPSAAYQANALAVLQQYGVSVNPVQQAVLTTLLPSYALTGPATSNNYSNASPFNGYSYNGVVKLDYTLNERNTISARGYGGQGNQTAPVGDQTPYYFETAPIHVYNYSVVWNTVLTPHLTNQVLAGVNYFNQLFYDANHSFDLAALGLNTGVGPGLSGAPSITIQGFDFSQDSTPPSGRNDITGLITDTVAYQVGKHDFRLGGEYRDAQVDEFYHRKERGLFKYDGSQGPWSSTGGTMGPGSCDSLATAAPTTPVTTDAPTLALADYLAGCAIQDGITIGDTARQVFVNTFDLFAQDAWQVTPHLNLNYGARFDYLGALHNGYQNLSIFDPTAANTTVPGIAFQGDQISSLYEAPHNNISPRVGFTYSPRGNEGTVIRAGFGVFFDEPNLNPFLDNRPPNNGASGAESNPAGPSPVANVTFNNVVIPKSGALIFPTSSTFAPYGTSAAGVPLTSGPVVNTYNLFSINPNFRSAYNWNYNFNIEKSIGPNLIATIGYVGSQARKLLVIEDINQAGVGSTPLGNAAQNLTRPYGTEFPYYGVINQINSAGTSNYNSLQTTVRTTNYHGLTSQFSYTWAHGLDEMTQYRNQSFQNSFDPKADYGNMDYDTRNNFTTYLNYALPGDLLKGPHWLTHGWQANSLITLHGGQPYTIYTGSDTSGTGEGEDRVNQVGSLVAGPRNIVNHSGQLTWFTNTNNSSFVSPDTPALPAQGFGTMRRNQLYGPGYEDVDLSLFKDGHLTEKVSAQFRVEMFNLFNRTNLAPPDSTYSDAAFGTIGTTIGNYNGAPGLGPGEPFNTQLALKIIF